MQKMFGTKKAYLRIFFRPISKLCNCNVKRSNTSTTHNDVNVNVNQKKKSVSWIIKLHITQTRNENSSLSYHIHSTSIHVNTLSWSCNLFSFIQLTAFKNTIMKSAAKYFGFSYSWHGNFSQLSIYSWRWNKTLDLQLNVSIKICWSVLYCLKCILNNVYKSETIY